MKSTLPLRMTRGAMNASHLLLGYVRAAFEPILLHIIVRATSSRFYDSINCPSTGIVCFTGDNCPESKINA